MHSPRIFQTSRCRNEFFDEFERCIQLYYSVVVPISNKIGTIPINCWITWKIHLSDPWSCCSLVTFHHPTIAVDHTNTILCCCCLTNNKPIVVQLNGVPWITESSVDLIHWNFTNTTSGWCIFENFVNIVTRNNNVSFLVYRHMQISAVDRPMWRSFIWQLNPMDQFSSIFTDIKNICMSNNVPSMNQSFHLDLPSISQRVNVVHIDLRWSTCNDIQLIIPTRDSYHATGCRQFHCVEIKILTKYSYECSSRKKIIKLLVCTVILTIVHVLGI